MSDVAFVEVVEQLRRANAGLREALTARDGEVEAKDAEIGQLRAAVHVVSLQVA